MVCTLLVLTTLAVFLPVVWHGFVIYDDTGYVTENAHVQSGLTWGGIVWAFTTGHTGNWHPLTWLSHMLDCQVYGLQPAGHHLTNLLFHAANTVLLFLWLRSLTGAFWRSAFVAALFALHPLRVESVAWVAERKDVLSSFFGLLSLWAYTAYARKSVVHPSRFTFHVSRFYVLSLVCFALGLMSKPMLVTWPFVLLLLDYWPLKRMENEECRMQNAGAGTTHHAPRTTHHVPRSAPRASRFTFHVSLLAEKVPFLLLATASSIGTFLAQRNGDAMATAMPAGERVANAVVSYARYIGKMLWPKHLSVLYPHPGQWPAGSVVAAGALVLAATVVVIFQARKRPYLAVGWLWFCGVLVPVIGLVQVGIQSMADRYTYLPSVGLFIILAWGGGEVAANWPKGRLALAAAATAALIACALITQSQLGHWQNTESLFRHTILVTKNNFVAWNNLGACLAEQRQLRQAERCYRTAIEIEPASEAAWVNLGCTLMDLNRKAEAIEAYETALRINPSFVKVHDSLATALAADGRLAEAQAHCLEAARLDPQFAKPYSNLGALLTREGKWDEAVAAFRRAVALDPAMSEARCGLGGALAKQGKYEEGMRELAELVKIQPTNAAARLQLAGILVLQGKVDQALAEYSEVLRANPTEPTAHYRLALALSAQGRSKEAIAEYRAAVKARPGYPEALNNLAWLLATCPDPQLRNGQEAVDLAERACRLTERKQAYMVGTLGAAYAEASRFPEAIAAAETARALAERENDKEVAALNSKLLALYRSGQPYRDTR
jgi:protein O-mannosyl-transferase